MTWGDQVGAGVNTEVTPKSEAEVSAAVTAAVENWRYCKAQLEAIKGQEATARAAMVELLFPQKVKGTQRAPACGGNVKLVHGLTYTLGSKDAVKDGEKVPVNDQVETAMDKIEAVDPHIADRLFNYKYSIDANEYEELCKSDSDSAAVIKGIIDEILEIKPASPQVTFEEAKA